MGVEIISTRPPTAATGCVVLCSHDEPWWSGAAEALDLEGFFVGRAEGVEGALHPAALSIADLLVLDLAGPAAESAEVGIEVCGRIRLAGETVVLAVGEHDGDVVADVLGAGADAYARRSRSARELAARVRALHRRTASVGRRRFDGSGDGARRVDVAVDVHRLTPDPVEQAVLTALLRHPGRVVSRPALLHAGLLPIDDAAVLDPVVRRLRGRIVQQEAPLRIVAVRGVGFRCDIVGWTEGSTRHPRNG